MRRKINYIANLKKSAKANALKNDATGIVSAIPYVLIPTLLGLTGYAGLATATGVTWLLGALFNNQAIKASAFGVAGVHLLYTAGGSVIEDMIGKPLWRMESPAGATTAQQQLNDGRLMPLQSGSRIVTLPNGDQTIASSNDNVQALNGIGVHTPQRPNFSDQPEARPDAVYTDVI